MEVDWSFCNRNNDKNQIEVALVAMGGHNGNGGLFCIVKITIFTTENEKLYMKILLNTEYRWLYDFVHTLPSSFDTLPNAAVLHMGRNEIKLVTVGDYKLVIKSYRSISFFNRIIYGRLRQSKSVRAYTNAMHLLSLGIATPKPIAAIDNYRRGVLRESMFIAELSEFHPIDFEVEAGRDRESLLDALAQFLARIHMLGVQHNDLNPANLRYRKGENGYEFELIDNNRMTFRYRALTERERLKDLRHFSCDTLPYVYVLDRYARLTGINSDLFATRGLLSRVFYNLRNRIKRSISRKLR